MMQSSTGCCKGNETTTFCMVDGRLINESCYMADVDQNASTVQERMDCASASLKKAIELHMLHMKEHCTATNESQMKMMEQMTEQMMNAYEYMTGENMTTGIMNKTIMEMTYQERMDCAITSLEMAMEIHMLYMKEYSMDTNESQVEMMEQMMQAYKCMTCENMAMGMTNDTTGVQFSGEYRYGCQT